jgi:hypothetical protein
MPRLILRVLRWTFVTTLTLTGGVAAFYGLSQIARQVGADGRYLLQNLANETILVVGPTCLLGCLAGALLGAVLLPRALD